MNLGKESESDELAAERVEALLSKAKDRETAEKLLIELKEAGAEGVPILVEGKRDEAALRAIGVDGNIYKLMERGVSRIAEQIATQHNDRSKKRTAIILTDPDHEGNRLASRAAYMLEQFGVHPDLKFRKLCRLLGKGAVEHLG